MVQSTNSNREAQQQHRKIARGVLLLACLLAAIIVAFATDAQFDVDDAPITYRYAENIAQGKGFVYNEGEKVLGTSTPLYAMLLALLHVVGVSTSTASAVISLVSTVIVVWLVFLITLRISHDNELAAFLAVAYLLVQNSFLRFTMSGMETPLYAAIILAAFFFLSDNRMGMAAAMAGLAFVARLDGLAVAVALFGTIILWQRRFPVREILIYTVVVAPWLLFATLYFGSPVPLSMLAKQHHLQSSGHSRYWIWNYLFVSGFGAPLHLLPFGIVGVGVTAKRFQVALCMFFWLVLYLVAYTVVGIDFYEWYLTPVYPILAVFVGAGLGLTISAVWNHYAQASSKRWQLLGWFAVFAMLLAWWLPYAQHANRSVRAWSDYVNVVERSRVEAGQWLAVNTPPDSSVYTGAIGHIGYQSGRYILDGAGLVTPQDILESAQPDYFVLQGYAPNSRECGPVAEFATHEFEATIGTTFVSGCGRASEGTIGNFTLADFRIARAVRAANGSWEFSEEPRVETQWLIDKALPDDQWTIITHFADESGQTVAQADHLLGRQLDGSVMPISAWSSENRIYVYTDAPDNWSEVRDRIESVRVGLWNPQTQEYLPITPGRSNLDESSLLKIDLDSIDTSQ